MLPKCSASKSRVFNDRGFPHPMLGSPVSLEGSPCLPGEPNWNENIVLSQTTTTFHHQQPSGWWLQHCCSSKETCGWHLFASFLWQFSSRNAKTCWLWLPHPPYHLHPCYALVASSLLLAPVVVEAEAMASPVLHNQSPSVGKQDASHLVSSFKFNLDTRLCIGAIYHQLLVGKCHLQLFVFASIL